MRVFVWAFAPKPRMLVFGAIDFAAAVARVGAFLGYHVTVCDARPGVRHRDPLPRGRRGRRRLAAPLPRRRGRGRPDRPRAPSICVLTHDPKFDVPLLEVALRLPEVAYVGAMGSRRTHDDRLDRLREAGLTEEELARLSVPIGLDLGARTPEETAVSIAAEIIAGAVGRLAASGWPAPTAGSTTPTTSDGSSTADVDRAAMSRRPALRTATAVAALTLLAGCSDGPPPTPTPDPTPRAAARRPTRPPARRQTRRPTRRRPRARDEPDPTSDLPPVRDPVSCPR